MPARPIGRATPWNKSSHVGQKKPLEPSMSGLLGPPKIARSKRDLAIFNLAIDSKLRGCDLVTLRMGRHLFGNKCAASSYYCPKEVRSTSSVRDLRAVEEYS